ncbi:hypothetical protein A3715_15895 [Oleiphilus sp. HI0009]|nr:hypothetical protein A3715_15895 [Oleiphilus sp. HI0009]
MSYYEVKITGEFFKVTKDTRESCRWVVLNKETGEERNAYPNLSEAVNHGFKALESKFHLRADQKKLHAQLREQEGLKGCSMDSVPWENLIRVTSADKKQLSISLC